MVKYNATNFIRCSGLRGDYHIHEIQTFNCTIFENHAYVSSYYTIMHSIVLVDHIKYSKVGGCNVKRVQNLPTSGLGCNMAVHDS